MRAIGVHEDVIVVTSRVWQTTCTAVRAGDETFVIDSPVYPDELEVLPAVLEQAGFAATGLLATHGDWDHLLGRLAFPDAALGCAETTAARLTGRPGDAQRELRSFDEQHYVERPRPLALGHVQALPVPGHCAVGSRELELHPTEGHTEDGMAIWIEWAGVLVCGDYVSPVEIPMIHPGGSVSAYLATLARLEPLVARADHIVPGHGAVLDSERARAIVAADVAYLNDLRERGAQAELPADRDDGEQRDIHRRNVAVVTGAGA